MDETKTIDDYNKVLKEIAEKVFDLRSSPRVFVSADAVLTDKRPVAHFTVEVFDEFETGHQLRDIAMKLRQTAVRIDEKLATELYKRGME